LRGKLTQGRDDEPFSLTARVWAVRGTVEG
jgi:hypothetical protein